MRRLSFVITTVKLYTLKYECKVWGDRFGHPFSRSPKLRFHFLYLLRQLRLTFRFRRAIHIMAHTLAVYRRRISSMPAILGELLSVSRECPAPWQEQGSLFPVEILPAQTTDLSLSLLRIFFSVNYLGFTSKIHAFFQCPENYFIEVPMTSNMHNFF